MKAHPQQQQSQQLNPYPAAPVMMAGHTGPPVLAAVQPGIQFVPVQQPAMQPHTVVIANSAAYSQPSHYLLLTAIVTIACGLLNLTSLVIGIPALACAFVAFNSFQRQQYSTTKNLGYTAAVFSIINIVYTGVVSSLVIGLTIGLGCHKQPVYEGDDYYSYSSCS